MSEATHRESNYYSAPLCLVLFSSLLLWFAFSLARWFLTSTPLSNSSPNAYECCHIYPVKQRSDQYILQCVCACRSIQMSKLMCAGVSYVWRNCLEMRVPLSCPGTQSSIEGDKGKVISWGAHRPLDKLLLFCSHNKICLFISTSSNNTLQATVGWKRPWSLSKAWMTARRRFLYRDPVARKRIRCC